VCVCVSTVTDFSAEDKASGVKFCMAVHRRPRHGMTHFGQLCSSEVMTLWRYRNVCIIIIITSPKSDE